MLQRRMKFDDVSPVHNLIQDRDWWFIRRRAHLVVDVFTVAATHGGFYLGFAQPFNQSLHARESQRLDQIVGWCFMSVG